MRRYSGGCRSSFTRCRNPGQRTHKSTVISSSVAPWMDLDKMLVILSTVYGRNQCVCMCGAARIPTHSDGYRRIPTTQPTAGAKTCLACVTNPIVTSHLTRSHRSWLLARPPIRLQFTRLLRGFSLLHPLLLLLLLLLLLILLLPHLTHLTLEMIEAVSYCIVLSIFKDGSGIG